MWSAREKVYGVSGVICLGMSMGLWDQRRAYIPVRRMESLTGRGALARFFGRLTVFVRSSVLSHNIMALDWYRECNTRADTDY
jgi:hypothetical protein